MPATTNRRTATGRPTRSPAPFGFTVTTGRQIRLATIVMLLAAAMVSGCSTKVTVGDAASDIVDPVRIQDTITRRLQATPDAHLGSVVCPRA
jgi:hypothetical protein